MCHRLKDLEAVSEALLIGPGLSSRPSEICSTSDHEGVGTLSSSRKCDASSTLCKACGSGPIPDWQQPLKWGQLNYVPILNRHDPEEQYEDSRRLINCSTPSREACNSTTALAFNGSGVLLVPCCGVVASQHKVTEQPHVACQPNNSRQLVNGPASVAAHELGSKLHIFEHTSAAKAAVGDPHHQQSVSSDNGLVLDAAAFAELQDRVAAAQLKAMFSCSASRASSSHASAADSSQELDSLALAHLEVPYKHVSGVGLCYVGGY